MMQNLRGGEVSKGGEGRDLPTYQAIGEMIFRVVVDHIELGIFFGLGMVFISTLTRSHFLLLIGEFLRKYKSFSSLPGG